MITGRATVGCEEEPCAHCAGFREQLAPRDGEKLADVLTRAAASETFSDEYSFFLYAPGMDVAIPLTFGFVREILAMGGIDGLRLALDAAVRMVAPDVAA